MKKKLLHYVGLPVIFVLAFSNITLAQLNKGISKENIGRALPYTGEIPASDLKPIVKNTAELFVNSYAGYVTYAKSLGEPGKDNENYPAIYGFECVHNTSLTRVTAVDPQYIIYSCTRGSNNILYMFNRFSDKEIYYRAYDLTTWEEIMPAKLLNTPEDRLYTMCYDPTTQSTAYGMRIIGNSVGLVKFDLDKGEGTVVRSDVEYNICILFITPDGLVYGIDDVNTIYEINKMDGTLKSTGKSLFKPSALQLVGNRLHASTVTLEDGLLYVCGYFYDHNLPAGKNEVVLHFQLDINGTPEEEMLQLIKYDNHMEFLGIYDNRLSGITTGISRDNNMENDINIYAVDDFIKIEGAEGKAVNVYSIDGKLIYKGIAETISLEKGIYIVKANETTEKIMIK